MSSFLKTVTYSFASGIGFVAGGTVGHTAGTSLVNSIRSIADLPSEIICPHCGVKQGLPCTAFDWVCAVPTCGKKNSYHEPNLCSQCHASHISSYSHPCTACSRPMKLSTSSAGQKLNHAGNSIEKGVKKAGSSIKDAFSKAKQHVQSKFNPQQQQQGEQPGEYKEPELEVVEAEEGVVVASVAASASAAIVPMAIEGQPQPQVLSPSPSIHTLPLLDRMQAELFWLRCAKFKKNELYWHIGEPEDGEEYIVQLTKQLQRASKFQLIPVPNKSCYYIRARIAGIERNIYIRVSERKLNGDYMVVGDSVAVPQGHHEFNIDTLPSNTISLYSTHMQLSPHVGREYIFPSNDKRKGKLVVESRRGKLMEEERRELAVEFVSDI